MMPTCHTCGYEFEVGELAWAKDWKVITTEGDDEIFDWETRYTCDDCEEKR